MPLMKTRKMLMNEINETTQDFIGELLSDYAPYQWGLISRMNHEDLNKLSSRMAELLSQLTQVEENFEGDAEDHVCDSAVEDFFDEFISLIFDYDDERSSSVKK